MAYRATRCGSHRLVLSRLVLALRLLLGRIGSLWSPYSHGTVRSREFKLSMMAEYSLLHSALGRLTYRKSFIRRCTTRRIYRRTLWRPKCLVRWHGKVRVSGYKYTRWQSHSWQCLSRCWHCRSRSCVSGVGVNGGGDKVVITNEKSYLYAHSGQEKQMSQRAFKRIA